MKSNGSRLKSYGSRLCAGMLLGLVTSLGPALAQVDASVQFAAIPAQSNQVPREFKDPYLR